MDNSENVMMIPWFEKEHYPVVLATMEDACCLPPRYEWWLQGAQEHLAALQNERAKVCIVRIEPTVFLEWCRARDYPPDSQARMEYAYELEGIPRGLPRENATPEQAA
jgi:hypothetical protein